jgi:hypothetical protein
MEQALEGAEQLHRVKRKAKAEPLVASNLPGVDDAAASYAVRVWNGQSPDVPVGERITRVLNALKGQNLIVKDLSMLHADANRFMEAYK